MKTGTFGKHLCTTSSPWATHSPWRVIMQPATSERKCQKHDMKLYPEIRDWRKWLDLGSRDCSRYCCGVRLQLAYMTVTWMIMCVWQQEQSRRSARIASSGSVTAGG